MKILIIEDNTSIAENISLYLQAKGYSTDIAFNGEQAFDMIQNTRYNFLIIDRMIPRIDGLSLVRMLQSRQIDIPFLFLTALGKQVDRIEGLSLGADDYLVKPFDLEELRLRIGNILKRRGVTHQIKTLYRVGVIHIDILSKQVSMNSIVIELSPKEFAVLHLLLENRGNILSREYIYESIWGDQYDGFSNILDTVNVHIANIRKKTNTDIIRTVKLSGYIVDIES
ncbi:response regulator transcription factor [Candidatus Gracilibacteria bacterium]|nr:response regulator transcription factor [Candidatus Gracilibacteria bacterium]